MNYEIIVPLLIVAAALSAIRKKADVFAVLQDGVMDGARTVMRIFPALVGLLSAVYMFRASGALDLFTAVVSPVLSKAGIPSEVAGLLIIRPLSGSGALAYGSELIAQYGADSRIGRIAAIMLGSTETTFYTLAIYLGSVKIVAQNVNRSIKLAIPAALFADLVAFVLASIVA